MCRHRIIFTQLKMNVWASWSVVNLTFSCNSRQNTHFTMKQEQNDLKEKETSFPVYPPFTSPLTLKAVGAHMTRVFGEEAAAVELHACGVVRVMLRLWCVDGPHSGSVLTLPECFN